MYAKFLLNICRKILKLHVESQSNSTASIEQQNIQEFTLTYHYTLQNTQAPSNFLGIISRKAIQNLCLMLTELFESV
jgi:hypothetical protein